MKISLLLFLLAFLLLLGTGCKQPYEPPPIRAANQFLVVDGVINASADATTTITLSRTRNLVDTFLTNPERSASVLIEGEGGGQFSLQEKAAGLYQAEHLSLDVNQRYRLHILSSGREYLSDFVAVKQTPPIDQVSWQKEDRGVRLYVSTHDPSNASRYYRWDFTETWQYQSQLETNWGVIGDSIFLRDSTNQFYNCWTDSNSTSIILGTSIKLSQDVIDRAPLHFIPDSSEKLGIRYSILVRQYALSQEAYQFWEILKDNTQSLGTLFDKQPGQLKSNIRNVQDASEPVIGFVSACYVPQQRIFIKNLEVAPWTGKLPGIGCGIMPTPQNIPFYKYTFPDTAYAPYYFVSMGPLMLALKECLDCRLRSGGSNKKPNYW